MGLLNLLELKCNNFYRVFLAESEFKNSNVGGKQLEIMSFMPVLKKLRLYIGIYSFIIECSIESIIFLQEHKAYMNHNFNFIIQKVQQITVLNFTVNKLARIYGL